MSVTENVQGIGNSSETTPWHVRFALELEARLRPFLGWGVLLVLAWIAVLPTFALRVNNWVELGPDQTVLELLGPLSIFTVWVVAGWRRPRPRLAGRWFGAVLMALLVLAAGFVVISQVAAGWIPGVREVAQSASGGGWAALAEGVASDWMRLGGRVSFWWAGVQSETTAQDNLVFLVIAGTLVWLVAALSAVLARRFRNGLLAAAPLLWLLGTILLYSQEGRILFVFGLGLAVLLHFLSDHELLLARWNEKGFDYSPGLFLDRLMLVLGAALLVLTLAAAMPNLYVQALVDRYYARMQPAYERLEDTADRLFPGVKGTSRFGGGMAGGLPNEFLLQAGPNLTDDVVMYVGTDDAVASDFAYDYVYETPPPGHYMRGGTLAEYDGRGWSNPPATEREDIEANTLLTDAALLGADLEAGRKEVVQQVALVFNTQVLYTAPEPEELSTGVRMEVRGPGDLVALWARDKTYTAVSRVPAVNDETLERGGGVGGWRGAA